MAIPLAMLYFYFKMGKKTSFTYLWWLFITFIVSCGFTHLIEVVETWRPMVRFATVVKVFCAIVSWLTVLALWKTVPQALKLRTPEELENIVKQRTNELRIKTEELEQSLRKEEQLITILRQREAELLEHDRQKTNFLAVLAHELRNPLAPIRTAIHVITKKYGEKLDGEYLELEGMLTRQLAHLNHMIDDLLDVARITRNKIILKVTVVPLLSTIHDSFAVLRSLDLMNKHQFQINCDEKIQVMADATRLEQILTNLLSNAVKYTDPNGNIWIDVTQNRDKVCISICDTGHGIEETDRNRIFDLFYQGDNTIERKGNGLGLGLTIVKQIMDLHGGIIHVESEVGKGSKFRLYFQAPNDSINSSMTY